jgi:hypothetical protein
MSGIVQYPQIALFIDVKNIDPIPRICASPASFSWRGWQQKPTS